MKQLLFLLLVMPALLTAQEDARYLGGAIPEVEGRVVFLQEIEASALSQNQIYDRLLNWAEAYFKKDNSRVVYSDKEKGDIAATGDEYIVFSSTALSLDRSRISYQVTIECKDHSCVIKMGNIRYTYDVSYQRDPERYVAEEWIVDKYALNKSKTKLNRVSGKFRRLTIDLADELFKGANTALGTQPVAAAQVVIPAVALTPATPAVSVSAPATAETQESVVAKDGFVSFAANKIPGTIIQMLSESPLSVAPGKDALLVDDNIRWKGLGSMFGKETASFSVSPESPSYKAIGNGEVYTISFLKKDGDSNGKWMMIDCRKQGETPDGNQVTVVGEVLNVWIK